MRYLVQNIKLPPDQRGEVLQPLVKGLGLQAKDLSDWRIVREAVDARRGQFFFVYHIEFELQLGVRLPKNTKFEVLQATTPEYHIPTPGDQLLLHPPVVVGAGPAGYFAALLLAEQGYRPLLIERGAPIEERIKDVEVFWKEGKLLSGSNVQFGEGGAGTFSDGKLTTQIRDPRVFKVLREFVRCGAPEEVLYKHKPHVGTDRLRRVVIRLRNRILELGGEIRFHTQLKKLIINQGSIEGIILADGNQIATESMILAIGHSARETFLQLFEQGLEMDAKPFSLGVRIEHLQDWVDEAQYGRWAGHEKVDPAEYKLVYHTTNGRTVYTFCMCPGGEVVASSSEEGHVVTNGMSYYARDGKNANSALLVGVSPTDFGENHPLAGLAYQNHWERLAYQAGGGGYAAPIQRVGDFLTDSKPLDPSIVLPTYTPSVQPYEIQSILPAYVADSLKEALPQLGKSLKSFDHPDGLLTAVESRSSSPVRMMRNPLGESNLKGLFPAGEGAGYSGGIISSAVDGLRSAECLIQKFRMR